jgi:hypothetical protein
VTIFEVAERPWGWLTTSAEVDERVYVGSRNGTGSNAMPGPPTPLVPLLGIGPPLTARKRTDVAAPDPRRGSAGMHRIRFLISDFKKNKNPAEKK